MFVETRADKELSIYIHWPFCLSKCPYCDFNSHVAKKIDSNLWLDSYLKELEFFAQIINRRYIKSIFFGGGTPSLMDAYIVEQIILKISSMARVDFNTEITLEANPTSYETNKFKDFKLAGINRVSIGTQSLVENDLKKLGREHSASQAKKAIESANNIFSRVSFDLIYAREGQTLNDWQNELEQAMELASGHISLYQLTIEKGTEFYKLFKEQKLALPNQDESAEMYEWTSQYLNDYKRYEISNYALTGQECIHNLTYWNYQDYLGIGPGAHSRLYDEGGVNSMMMWHKPEKWLKSVAELSNAIQLSEYLTEEESIEEFFMMGLRLTQGVNLANIGRITKKTIDQILDLQIVHNYANLGLLNFSDKNIKLTDKGLVLHSYLVPRLLLQ